MAVDANFGLVHKKSSGTEKDTTPPEFFIGDADVSYFMENYDDRTLNKDKVNF